MKNQTYYLKPTPERFIQLEELHDRKQDRPWVYLLVVRLNREWVVSISYQTGDRQSI